MNLSGPSRHKPYAGGQGAIVRYCLSRKTGYRWLRVTEGGRGLTLPMA